MFLIGVGDRKRLSYFYGGGHWELDYVPMRIWATQIGLGVSFFFFSFVGRGQKGGRMGMGGVVREYDKGTLYNKNIVQGKKIANLM